MNYLSSLERWGVEGRWLILKADRDDGVDYPESDLLILLILYIIYIIILMDQRKRGAPAPPWR
jgi:hypothetical protein